VIAHEMLIMNCLTDWRITFFSGCVLFSGVTHIGEEIEVCQIRIDCDAGNVAAKQGNDLFQPTKVAMTSSKKLVLDPLLTRVRIPQRRFWISVSTTRKKDY
jgi:hypothetical protein